MALRPILKVSLKAKVGAILSNAVLQIHFVCREGDW